MGEKFKSSAGTRRRRNGPWAIGIVAVAATIGAVISLVRGPGAFPVAYGGLLEIEALVVLAVAWIAYLRKDGVRFFSFRAAGAGKRAEGWRDRVPVPGQPPLPPPLPPDAEGPSAEEYQRLAEAEESLRKRILGEDADPEAAGRDGGRGLPSILALIGAGAVLFSTGLILEYLVPRLLR